MRTMGHHTLALQTFNDIPQNININNSTTNRLKERLLYQVNHAVSPAEAEMSDIHVNMWLRLGLLILIQIHFHRSFSNF
jgi:hypothetical protein